MCLLTRSWSDRALLAAAIGLGVLAPLLDLSLVSEHGRALLRARFQAAMGGAIHAGDYTGAVRAVGTRTMALYGASGGFGLSGRYGRSGA